MLNHEGNTTDKGSIGDYFKNVQDDGKAGKEPHASPALTSRAPLRPRACNLGRERFQTPRGDLRTTKGGCDFAETYVRHDDLMYEARNGEEKKKRNRISAWTAGRR